MTVEEMDTNTEFKVADSFTYFLKEIWKKIVKFYEFYNRIVRGTLFWIIKIYGWQRLDGILQVVILQLVGKIETSLNTLFSKN